MALRQIFARSGEYAIKPLGSDDAGVIARLHMEGFGRPWSDGEFASLLSKDTVFGFAAQPHGRPGSPPEGFVLARLAADEAEILAISVAASRRRRGLGRALMDAVLRHLYAQRAQSLFLEVDEGNAGAIALYRRLGFDEVARREAYYGSDETDKSAAIVMRRELLMRQ